MPKLIEIEVSKETKLSNFTISVNDCIALCHIVEEFENFINNLKLFAKGRFGYLKLKNLYNYVKEPEAFVSREVKIFYNNNSKVLDAIHKNTYISNFLLIYFDNKTGKFNQEINGMYEYIKNNNENKYKILSVLEKLKKIGFKDFAFAENEKFDNEYEYSKYDDYYFVDGNIEIIPSIKGFKYKTIGANYEIKFSTIPFHHAKILLNNLVFDSNLLPNDLSYDNTMKKIISLIENKKLNYKVLSDCICMDYNIEKIIPSIEKLDEIIIDIHNCSDKSIAKEHIDIIKKSILELQWILSNYEKDIIEQNLVSAELLEEEKNIYIKN